MKTSDFNNLLNHIEQQIKGFKITYKLYDSVYCFKDGNKEHSLEFRYEASNLLNVKLYSLIKDKETGKLVDAVLKQDSTYKLTSIQSVKILTLLEGKR